MEPALTLHQTDGTAIACRAVARAGGAGPGLVFLGGFMSDMTGEKAQAVEGIARGRGLPAIRFDYRGHGESGGAFEDFTLSDWLADARGSAPATAISALPVWELVFAIFEPPKGHASLPC